MIVLIVRISISIQIHNDSQELCQSIARLKAQHEEEREFDLLADDTNQKIAVEEKERALEVDIEGEQVADRGVGRKAALPRPRGDKLVLGELYEVEERLEEDRVREVLIQQRDERLRNEFITQSELINMENERQLAVVTAEHRRQIEIMKNSFEQQIQDMENSKSVQLCTLEDENMLHIEEIRTIAKVIEDLKQSKKVQIMEIEYAQLKHNVESGEETRLQEEQMRKVGVLLDELMSLTTRQKYDKHILERISKDAQETKYIEIEEMERTHRLMLFDLQSSHDLLERTLLSRTLEIETNAKSNQKMSRTYSDEMKEAGRIFRENDELRILEQNMTVEIHKLENERKQQTEIIVAIKQNYFEDIENLNNQKSEDLRELKMLLDAAHSVEIGTLLNKVESAEEEKNNLSNLIIMAEDRERTYNIQLENAMNSLLQAQTLASKQMLAVNSGNEMSLKSRCDEYENKLTDMNNDCISQLRTHSASHIVEFAVVSESHARAIEMLRLSYEDMVEKAHADSGELVTHLQCNHRREIQDLLICHSKEKTEIVSKNNDAVHAIQSNHIEEMRAITNIHQDEMSAVQLEKEKAIRIAERKAIQILQLTESVAVLKDHLVCQKEEEIVNGGAQSEKIVRRLKAKLDAVGIEFAHSEGRYFQLLASKVREKEEITALLKEHNGSSSREIATRKEATDAASQLENQIHDLQMEYDAQRNSASGILYRGRSDGISEKNGKEEMQDCGRFQNDSSPRGSDIADRALLVLLGVKGSDETRLPSEEINFDQRDPAPRGVDSAIDEMPEKERQRVATSGIPAPQIKSTFIIKSFFIHFSYIRIII